MLLIVGLLTPFAAAGVVGVMGVAWMINHRGNGFFIFRPGEGWEYVMTLGIVGIAIGALGPGEWSLDHAFEIDDDLSARRACSSPRSVVSAARSPCSSRSGGRR